MAGISGSGGRGSADSQDRQAEDGIDAGNHGKKRGVQPLEREAILCEGSLITAEHLSLNRDPPAFSPNLCAPPSPTTDSNAVERDRIVNVLGECSGNKSKAAARLGLSRTQLYLRLRRHRLF